jgi:hypothetical protein
MKLRISSLSAVLAATFAVAAAGCAHGNGNTASAAPGAVRLASNESEVSGCERLSEVRVSGTWTKSAAREELRTLAKSKGANVLLVQSNGTDGYAYRCSGGTTASN